MNKRLIAAATAALVLATTACSSGGSDASSSGSASSGGKKRTVALINGVLTGQQSVCAFSGTKKVLDAAGDTWVDKTSAYNVEDELRNVQAAISQNVDLIMLWSAFPQSAATEVRAAKAAGIPIYLFWNEGADVGDDVLGTAYYDFKGSGVAVGKWIATNKPGAKVMELTGSLGSGTAEAISDGVKEGMGSSGSEEVQQDAEWSADKAASLASQLLPAHPDVNVIVTHNDEMALSVIRVVDQMKLGDKVSVVTESISSDAGIAAAKDKTIPFSALDPLAQYGSDAMTNALELLDGKTDKKAIDIGPSHYDTTGSNVNFCYSQYSS